MVLGYDNYRNDKNIRIKESRPVWVPISQSLFEAVDIGLRPGSVQGLQLHFFTSKNKAELLF